MKTLLMAGVFALAGIALFPGAASAELYQYVACNGSVRTTNADTWQMALTTSDLATHSGVILVTSGGLEIPSSMVVPGAGC